MSIEQTGVDALASLRRRVDAARQPKLEESQGHFASFYRFLAALGEKKDKK